MKQDSNESNEQVDVTDSENKAGNIKDNHQNGKGSSPRHKLSRYATEYEAIDWHRKDK